MTIRLAKIGEDEAIHSAHMRSIREVCIHAHGESEVKGWGYRECGDRWRQSIAEGLVWVVEHDGHIEGVSCIKFNGDHAHIHSLYLTPIVLGQGYGYALMNRMIEMAGERGIKRIDLESTLNAHHFYLRVGFVDAGPMGQTDIGGHPVRYLPMFYMLP